jgi:hypothetical protein
MLEVHLETHRSSGIFSELNDSRNGFTVVKFICNKSIAILSALLILLHMDGWMGRWAPSSVVKAPTNGLS